MNRYDVIVIGSGLGGLVCGLLLAETGRRVLVLERHWQPGGCLQSYVRKGHTFDTGFHYVGGLAEGQPLRAVFSRLGLLQLPWHRMDVDGFDRVTIGGRTYCLAEGYDHFVDVLANDFPQEREALRRYVDMLQGPDPDPSVNAYDWLMANFSNPLLVDVVSGASLKTELRKESLPLMAFAHNQKSYIQSSWRLQGDSGLVVRALTEGIRLHGGTVVCRAAVEQLVEREGRLAAALCSNGEAYEADCFISDIHPQLTFPLIKDSRLLKGIFRKRIARLENTAGIYTHSLLLKPKALHYFNHNKIVYGGTDVWNEQTPRVMLSCRVPEDDSDYAAMLDLMTTSPADPMPLAETVVPGLHDMVSACYVSTPHTWQRFTLTPDGSAFGVRKDCRQPLNTMLSVRTPIPNLWLTGQSVMLHGVEGVVMTAIQTVESITQEKI